jgi:hypothetical protein
MCYDALLSPRVPQVGDELRFDTPLILWNPLFAQTKPAIAPQMELAAHLRHLFEAEKQIGGDNAWHFDADGSHLRISLPLAIEFSIPEGLYLEGRCTADLPDRDVSLTLAYKPAQGLAGPLCRIDWRPLQPHRNNGLGSGRWRFIPIEGSQLHVFDQNLSRGVERMFRENLPIALPIEEPLQNFRELLSYAGQIMRVSDIQSVQPPPWSPRLV